MIAKDYSECDKCLEHNHEAKELVEEHHSKLSKEGKGSKLIETKLADLYEVSSIIDLLEEDIPGSIKGDIVKNIKPKGPGDSTKWFTGTNINQCLQRINRMFEKMEGGLDDTLFSKEIEKELDQRIPKYIPFHMRDEVGELQRVDFDGYNCFGTVLNTDYYDGEGIHWVAIFVNVIKEPYTLEYFDSGGEAIMKETLEYFKKLKELIIKRFEPKKDILIINVSNRIQQVDDYSCGSYALYYVYARLQGVPWRFFRDYPIGDHRMHTFRKHLFRLA